MVGASVLRQLYTNEQIRQTGTRLHKLRGHLQATNPTSITDSTLQSTKHMPLVGGTTTGTNTTAMASDSRLSHPTPDSNREQTPELEEGSIASAPSPKLSYDSDDSQPSIAYEFNESQCLFCNRISPNLDSNIAHMAKSHGLHIEPANLLVDIGSLLAYFHVVISGCYECLYCGTQRTTRQGVQQHMMGKGHCKYDLANADSELREFYDLPSSDAKDDFLSRQQDSPATIPRPQPNKARPSRRPPPDAGQPLPSSALTTTTTLSHDLTPRQTKQATALQSQLTHLRAADRANLLHLPESRQRALLLTHHKQMEQVRRGEQSKRGRLESSTNLAGRLGTVRLVRVEPHWGHTQTLKR
jgi:pre-60S factor REI1